MQSDDQRRIQRLENQVIALANALRLVLQVFIGLLLAKQPQSPHIARLQLMLNAIESVKPPRRNQP